MIAELKGWSEITRVRGIWRLYALFLSPDESKSALVSLEEGSIIAIYDRVNKQMEYAEPQLVKGVNLLHNLFEDVEESRVAQAIASEARCAHCKVRYISVEDFEERNPRRGEDLDLFVDSFCWDAYLANRNPGEST